MGRRCPHRENACREQHGSQTTVHHLLLLLDPGSRVRRRRNPAVPLVRMRASYARYGRGSKKIWEVCRIREKMAELGMSIWRARSGSIETPGARRRTPSRVGRTRIEVGRSTAYDVWHKLSVRRVKPGERILCPAV